MVLSPDSQNKQDTLAFKDKQELSQVNPHAKDGFFHGIYY